MFPVKDVLLGIFLFFFNLFIYDKIHKILDSIYLVRFSCTVKHVSI